MKATKIAVKTTAVLLCLLASAGLFTGCGSQTRTASSEAPQVSQVEPQASADSSQNTEQSQALAEDTALSHAVSFIFASGAGGWQTTLNLNTDLTFTGEFHDSDMGDTDADYPNGTQYLCQFSGRFGHLQAVDEHTYLLMLEELSTQTPKDETKIENGVRYIAAEPHGLEDSKEFLLYTPGTPTDKLSPELLQWGKGSGVINESDPQQTLPGYALYNRVTGYGFFSQQ